jgi:hypothetical protein
MLRSACYQCLLLAATWAALAACTDIATDIASADAELAMLLPAAPAAAAAQASPPAPAGCAAGAGAGAGKPFCYSRDMYPAQLFVHVHLTKCGGTSLNKLFDETNCGYDSYSFDPAKKGASVGVATRLSQDRHHSPGTSSCGFYSFEFPSLPALISALFPPSPPSPPRAPAPRMLTIVRQPTLQVLSLFRHIRKYLKYARCRAVADILSGRCRAFDFRNMQVRCCLALPCCVCLCVSVCVRAHGLSNQRVIRLLLP